MKTFKWVYRYSYLGVLLVMSLCWCGYCLYTISDIKSALHSVEYVDMTLGSFSDAFVIFERSLYYKELLNKGLIASAIIFGAIVLLIVFQIVAPKVAKRHEISKIKRQERKEELKRMREEQAKNAPRPVYTPIPQSFEVQPPAAVPMRPPEVSQHQGSVNMQQPYAASPSTSTHVQPSAGFNAPNPGPMQPPVVPPHSTVVPQQPRMRTPQVPQGASQTAPASIASAGTFCPFCGIKLATDSVFCATCGNRIGN